jgi:glycosyltransferase involved in cell wall biosynthesis
MNKVSAFIICRNEEKAVARALDSLKWADEVIIADGLSTDKTVEVCKSYGARVLDLNEVTAKSLLGSRNAALEACQYEWIFVLDADEVCSPELIQWMEKFKIGGENAVDIEAAPSDSLHPLGMAKTTRIDMYEHRRLEHFRGRLYRYGAGNPSHQWRFFRKTKGVHYTGLAHEYPVFEGEIRRVEKPILHFPTVGLEGIMTKINRASDLDAEQFFQEGKIHSAPYMFFSGLAMFLKSYFRKRGFRDGVLGFILSVLDGTYFFLRQAKLYIRNREAGRI